MTTIALCNLKGGTGKTTTAILLGEALHRRGCRTTILDADPQGSATEWAAIAADAGNPLSTPVLAANIQTLKRHPYDTSQVTLIDCPPGNPNIIQSAIDHSDITIIPTSPSAIEVDRMWETLDIVPAGAAGVLLTSVQLNTITHASLVEALDHRGVATYQTIILDRQAIKRLWGSRPEHLHGYQDLAEELTR